MPEAQQRTDREEVFLRTEAERRAGVRQTPAWRAL